MKKKILYFVILVYFAFGLYAGGSKDIDTIEMPSNESWQESIDISSKKKGKYNIIITATDIAGNEGYVGPFNMYVDPNSDLPIVRISNPKTEAVVPGNLNVVGTCVDDDAVDYVELRIDGGEEIFRAKGKEFWSYFINTENLEEGTHIIEAWGVDVNGLRGRSVKKAFYLNTHSPTTTVANKEVGELVSGKITIEGTVQDGNGVERLLYSLNDGENFEDIKLSYNKKTKQSKFSLKVNTKNIPDGPKVLWFKSIDKHGSVGIYTFLLFVDNTPPSVAFIYPNTDEVFPPVFSLAGSASDSAGLASLSWSCNKESGDFDIVPGNHYWIKEFDLCKAGGRSATIEITATDIAGNVVKTKKNIMIDHNKGKPVIEMLSPIADARVRGNLFISGVVHDLYGPAEIRYRIDKGEEKAVLPADAGFGVLESGIREGSHVLTIYAVNKKGIAGQPLNVKFTIEGSAPSISFDNNQTVIPVYNAQSKVLTSVFVRSAEGLKYVGVSFNGGEENVLPVKAGQKEYVIKPAINAKSQPGIYTISVTATDINEKTTNQTLAIRVVSAAGVGGEEGFVWAIGDANESGQLILRDSLPLLGIYQPKDGMVIESVEVIGGEAIEAEFEGNLIKLFVKNDGTYKGVGLKITDSEGNVFTSPQVDLLSDISSPSINLEMEEIPIFVKNSIVIRGAVSDGAGIKNVEYSLGGDSAPVSLPPKFSSTINISGQPDGPILLKVRVTDIAGREEAAYRVFYKDTEPPESIMVLPEIGDKVNGSVYSAFRVSDKFPNVVSEYKGGNKDAEWKTFDYSTMPNLIIGSAKEPINKNMQFRFTDLAGNSRIFNSYDFEIDNSVDTPVVDIHLPAENEVIIKDFEISGMVYDDDEAAKIYYKIDDGAYKSLEIKNSFSIPILLSDLTDNEHIITVYAEDIYGVVSEPVKRKIRVSLETPLAGVAYPIISDTVKGVTEISGVALDKNGIKQVEISLDNGLSFNFAEGGENWKYKVNTSVINDGTHVVFVRTTDNYDQTALFSTLINIDNTPPVLKLEYPLAGSKLDSNLFVSGQIYDNIELEGVMLKIKSLDGKKVPEPLSEIKLEKDIILARDIDISTLPEGRYNLEISGVDKAKNTNEASINFDVYRKQDKNKIELLYPLNGEIVRGEFNVYGRILLDKKVEEASLLIDGQEVETVPISKTGYVAFKLNPEKIAEGKRNITLRVNQGGLDTLSSDVHTVNYEAVGPWITIDNLAMGDFAIERPYLRGRAGYSVSDEEKKYVASKAATSEDKRAFKAKKVKRIEISFDNGKTFVPAKSTNKWKFRLETEDLAAGNHFLLIRAIMENKEVAVCRTIIKIDKTAPSVTLIAPGEGGRYNNAIEFSGLASDNIELAKVEASLRKGDKANYGVPKFIQGLHVETAFFGASLWNIGLGLSFFDDNVKLQVHYGQMLKSQFKLFFKDDAMRYGGHIISLKLLANVYDMPFGYYFGPDWKWLYLDVALGAQFALFTETQSGRPQVLSALLLQLEFPRVKLPKQKYFSTFSFFTEGQLWFIPTDVESNGLGAIKSLRPNISAGIRFDIF